MAATTTAFSAPMEAFSIWNAPTSSSSSSPSCLSNGSDCSESSQHEYPIAQSSFLLSRRAEADYRSLLSSLADVTQFFTSKPDDERRRQRLLLKYQTLLRIAVRNRHDLFGQFSNVLEDKTGARCDGNDDLGNCDYINNCSGTENDLICSIHMLDRQIATLVEIQSRLHLSSDLHSFYWLLCGKWGILFDFTSV